MPQNLPSIHIHNPVLRNSGAGVHQRFRIAVKPQTAIGDFDEERNVFRAGSSLSERRCLPPQNGNVGFRFVYLARFAGKRYRVFLLNKFQTENVN